MAVEALAALALVCEYEEQERAFASMRSVSICKPSRFALMAEPFNKYAYYLDRN